MSQATCLAQVKSILEGVTDKGIVHDYSRWARDWGNFLDLFKVSSPTDQIRGWEITRTSTPEVTETSRTNKQTHSFTIRGYMSLDDSAATEKVFQALVESVADAFRNKPDLNGVALNVSPLQRDVVDFRMFGSVLCHFAECTLNVEEEVQWS